MSDEQWIASTDRPAADIYDEQPAPPLELPAVLVARCMNYVEADDELCTGRIRFRWGQSQAPCDTCGGYCGIGVAAWERVEGGEQPAPTAREIPADELAEAEAICREWLPLGRDGEAIYRVMAEYDERGRERDAARAASTQLAHDLARSVNAKAGYSRLLRGMARRLWKHRLAFRQIRRAGAAAEHRLEQERDAARAAVAEAHAVRDRALMKHAEQYAEIGRLRHDLAEEEGAHESMRQTIVQLRGRDEAAKAVARRWNGLGGCSQAVLRDPRRGFRAGADALDALARAHEAGGAD